nr:MAG TPA: DNA REPAIR HELICASE RAD25, SSL2, PRE-INITIATION COMPLEX, RNA POLYMERASE.0A [Caudoviricetes sp.]
MTENEAIEAIQFDLKIGGEIHSQVLCDAVNVAIQALETVKKLSDRNMTAEVLENYMRFEDECVKKGFTFKSVIEAREKQIAKKPIFGYNLSDTLSVFHCECGNTIKVSHDIGIMNNNNAPNYCSKCGQKLDWSDEE